MSDSYASPTKILAQEETASVVSQELVCNVTSSVQRQYAAENSAGACSDETLSASTVCSPPEQSEEEQPPVLKKTPQQQPHLSPAPSQENTQENPPDSVALSAPRENPPNLAASAHEDIKLPNTAPKKLLDSAPQGKLLDPAASAQRNLLHCPEENGIQLDPAAENAPYENPPELDNASKKAPSDCGALPEEMIVDNCYFESKEVCKKLKIARFLEGGRRGHTWRHTASVKIKGKKVSVTLLLFPSDSTGGQEKAMLGVAAEMEQKLYRVLSELNSECEIKVETKVLDRYVGKSHGLTEFEFHPINMENGKVNYRQELADCSKMRILNRNNPVDLVVKIKINTKTVYPYLNFELGGKGNNDVNP